MYHLNIGQPDIKTHPSAVERFRKIDWDVLEYSPSNGITSYREALTDYYARFNVDLEADNIMVTTGGSEAILLRFPFPMDGDLEAPLLTGVNLQFEVQVDGRAVEASVTIERVLPVEFGPTTTFSTGFYYGM